jgi:hypothetical protein
MILCAVLQPFVSSVRTFLVSNQVHALMFQRALHCSKSTSQSLFHSFTGNSFSILARLDRKPTLVTAPVARAFLELQLPLRHSPHNLTLPIAFLSGAVFKHPKQSKCLRPTASTTMPILTTASSQPTPTTSTVSKRPGTSHMTVV